MARPQLFNEPDEVDYRTTKDYANYCTTVLRSMKKGEKLTTRNIREGMGELFSDKFPLGDVLLTLSAQCEVRLIEGFIDRYIRETRIVLRDPVSRYNGRVAKQVERFL